MKRGEEIDLTLERFAFEGKSVGRHDGLVVFVHGAVPGDRARVRIVKAKKQFSEARMSVLLEPSPLRTAPRCRHAGVCGGCRWQHVLYGAQLDFKRQHVVDALERIGGFRGIAVAPALGSPEEFWYRNKMEFSFGDRWLSDQEMAAREQGVEISNEYALGLHLPGRFDRILDLEECWLQSRQTVPMLATVRDFCRRHRLRPYSTVTHTGFLRNVVLREGKRTGEIMVNIVTHDDEPLLMAGLTAEILAAFPSVTTVVNNITQRKSQVAIGDREVVYHGPGFITERIGPNTFRISANSFFQTNTLQAERLYDAAARLALLRPDDVLWDLYSGTGSIALHVARSVASVIGVEAVESAVADARRNAENNGIENCRFVIGDLKDRLTTDTGWLQDVPLPSVVIVDPPRTGMHEKVVRRLRELNPERIVYVSCNPTTQARDAALLCQGGLYAPGEVQPVDMFPHTYHIENVMQFRRDTTAG